MRNRITTREELEENRRKHMFEFAQKYGERIHSSGPNREGLGDADECVLDLYAEYLGLSISKRHEVSSTNLMFFLESGKCSDFENSLLDAEDVYIEQFLPEPDEKDIIRQLNRKTLLLVKKELGKEADEIGLIDIAVNMFDCELSLIWLSSDKPDRFGRIVHRVSRRESRERLERVRNTKV